MLVVVVFRVGEVGLAVRRIERLVQPDHVNKDLQPPMYVVVQCPCTARTG